MDRWITTHNSQLGLDSPATQVRQDVDSSIAAFTVPIDTDPQQLAHLSRTTVDALDNILTTLFLFKVRTKWYNPKLLRGNAVSFGGGPSGPVRSIDCQCALF